MLAYMRRMGQQQLMAVMEWCGVIMMLGAQAAAVSVA